MKSYKRSQRVADQIKRDIAEIIADMLRDRSGLMVTISDVDVTGDLKCARIYYTVLGDSLERLKKAKAFFDNGKHFIQGELSRRLHIRKLPELSFHYDKSLIEGLRISALIDEVVDRENGKND